MENSATPGYYKEKLFDGFEARTIPIHHGWWINNKYN